LGYEYCFADVDRERRLDQFEHRRLDRSERRRADREDHGANAPGVTRDVLILEKFPFSDPSASIKWERRKTVLVSVAEDRSRTARVKDKGGLSFEAFEVTFSNKNVAELQTAHDFFDRFYPGKKFIFEDKLRNIRKIVYFDSNISHEADASCAINFSFRINEA
jgi:hypothetical protein